MKFMQIKPQKARGLFKPSMWLDPSWSAENKEDGDRRIAQFGKTGGARVRFTGTRESVDGTGFVEKSGNLPHLNEFGSGLDGTVLDGEIVCPETKGMSGGRSKYVTAVMGSSPARARALQEQNGWMEYVVFDCLWFRGDDLRGSPLHERRRAAFEAMKIWRNKYAHLSHGYTKEREKYRAWESAAEGLVFKHEDHTYGNEQLWVKLKKEWTADVVIMGFEPGKGKYKGQVGAIQFGQIIPENRSVTLMQFGTCSGFDDALRAKLTKHPKKYLGQVIEIAHNGREPTGAFRHPRFKRFRSDKSAKDCVYREDEI